MINMNSYCRNNEIFGFPYVGNLQELDILRTRSRGEVLLQLVRQTARC